MSFKIIKEEYIILHRGGKGVVAEEGVVAV